MANAILNVVQTAGAAATGNELLPGAVLTPGLALHSPNGLFTLQYQTDGNLVLVFSMPQCPKVLWQSGTTAANGMLAMQGDGNLVLYDAPVGGVAVWASGTANHFGAHAFVQNDGNFVIYDASGQPLWNTATTLLPAAHGDTMRNGERLESITSADGRFRLQDTCAGYLTLTRADVPLWPPANAPYQAGGPVNMEAGYLDGYDSFQPPRSLVFQIGASGIQADHLQICRPAIS